MATDQTHSGTKEGEPRGIMEPFFRLSDELEGARMELDTEQGGGGKKEKAELKQKVEELKKEVEKAAFRHQNEAWRLWGKVEKLTEGAEDEEKRIGTIRGSVLRIRRLQEELDEAAACHRKELERLRSEVGTLNLKVKNELKTKQKKKPGEEESSVKPEKVRTKKYS